jgi:hypothetical protein
MGQSHPEAGVEVAGEVENFISDEYDEGSYDDSRDSLARQFKDWSGKDIRQAEAFLKGKMKIVLNPAKINEVR